MYKLLPTNEFGKTTTVQRTTGNVFIPFDPANTDFQEYQKWLALGNQPLPADAP